MPAATERDIAIGVMRIASEQANLICSFKRAYAEIPNYVKLTATNLSPSLTRNGEVMWEQLVRNIKSHSNSPDNFINRGWLEHLPKVGYRVTENGLKRLKRGF